MSENKNKNKVILCIILVGHMMVISIIHNHYVQEGFITTTEPPDDDPPPSSQKKRPRPRPRPREYNLTSHKITDDWWEYYSSSSNNNNYKKILSLSHCLDSKWLYVIGDSNSLKITEAFRGNLFSNKNSSRKQYVAKADEYAKFKAGEIKWWQDSDEFITFKNTHKNNNNNNNNTNQQQQQQFRFSFRFQQQGKVDNMKRKIQIHMEEPNRVFIKDGKTEWYPKFLPNETSRYGKHPDILWLSLGQWIDHTQFEGEKSANANSNNNETTNNYVMLCNLINDIYEMFKRHPAKIKIWMNLPGVHTKKKQMAFEFQQCEKKYLDFSSSSSSSSQLSDHGTSMYYFDIYGYTLYYQNQNNSISIFGPDGYHLLPEHQKVIMLNVLDVICSNNDDDD